MGVPVTWLEGLAVQEAERHEYWHPSSMVYSGSQQYCDARQGCGREISTVETLDVGRISHTEVPLVVVGGTGIGEREPLLVRLHPLALA